MDKIKTMARAARGQINNIFCHWTAGHYGQFFDDYHISIDGDGTIYTSTTDLAECKPHTWHRNTGTVGVALCCAYEANLDNLGDEPPTEIQIDTLARVLAVLCRELGLPSSAVLTHAEAAKLDGYGLDSGDPETRWDLWILREGDEPGSGGVLLRDKIARELAAWRE